MIFSSFHFLKMEKVLKNLFIYIAKIRFWAVFLVFFYIIWTKPTEQGNFLVIWLSAIVSSMIFQKHLPLLVLSIKKLTSFLIYIPFLIKDILKAIIDVASRVIKPVIPVLKETLDEIKITASIKQEIYTIS